MFEPNALILLGPGIRQRLGEIGDREIRRRSAIDDRRNDAGRNEGKRCQLADVPFALGFTLCNFGEGGNSTDPDVVSSYVLSRFREPRDEVVGLIGRAADEAERLVEKLGSAS